MAKIIYMLKMTRNVVKNTIRLRLWRAALRKIYSQSFKDKLSEDARRYYQTTSISLLDAMADLGFEQQGFRWPSSAKDYLSQRIQHVQFKRQRMGGIGSVEFLYSLVRAKSKKNCLECGVSMGGSSLAILSALQCNGEGVLYSNDLPYLWMDDPLKDLGVLVDDDLKGRWELTLGDDKDNLPAMLNAIGRVDMAHYDSNKAYHAREKFWTSLIPFMDEQCTVVFDDIVDNDHFFDLARSLSKDVWRVIVMKDQDKFIGLLQKV